jgi:hypothetical protein
MSDSGFISNGGGGGTSSMETARAHVHI